MTTRNNSIHQEVSFQSEGVACAADLFLQDSPGAHPALVIGHGWNQTKQGLRREGEMLHAAGYNVMIIDYRTLGKSEGQPRGQIYPRRQVDDLRNAITYFSRRPDVDAERIGIYGVSFAGGLAIQTTALDMRIKVCISQSPIVDGRRWMRELRNAYDYNQLLLEVQRDFEESYDRPLSECRKVTHYGPSSVAIPEGAVRQKGEFDPDNPNSCAFPKECQDSFNEMICFDSVRHVLEFNPTDSIDLIAPRPLLIVGNDGGPYDWIHPPEAIQDAFSRAREPKQLVFLPYDAYGLYMEPGRSDSMAVIIPFLNLHLKHQ